jgi:hypothetical protein
MKNWNTSMITEIYHSRPYTNCTAGYEPLFKGVWPGTKAGCDCSKVKECVYWNKKHRITSIMRRACSKTSLKCGCTNIKPHKARGLYSWDQANGLICVKREPGLSYEYLYDNVNTNGKCKKGYKKCGSPRNFPQQRNSNYFLKRDNSVCIPSNFQCPVNNIIIYPTKSYLQKYRYKHTTHNPLGSRKRRKRTKNKYTPKKKPKSTKNKPKQPTSNPKGVPKDWIPPSEMNRRLLKQLAKSFPEPTSDKSSKPKKQDH